MSNRLGTRVLLAVVIVMAAALPVPVVAGAAPTIVTFEDLSHANTGRSWTRLTSHGGVGFGDGVTAIDYSQPGYQVSGFSTHSGTVGIEECFGEEFSCPDPIDMIFGAPMFRLKVWVGYTGSTFGRTVVLEAFDGTGSTRRLLGADRDILKSQRGQPVPVNTPLEVVMPTNSILSAQVRFVDADGNTLDSYGLVADDIEYEAGAPAFAITPAPMDHGDVLMGQSATETATVTNTGQVRGSIKEVAVSGGDAGDFAITSDGCSGRNIAGGASCSVSVRFTPGAQGTRASTLVAHSDAPDGPDAIRLLGRGVVSTTTSQTTTSTTPGPGPDLPPGDPATTTTSAISTTTTATVPPPTPGTTLTLDRAVGRTGAIVVATGAGFQPGPVSLAWTPGLGVTQAEAGPDGTFVVAVLLLDGDDILGPRSLVATGAVSTASAPFLAVPSTMRPGGSSADIVHRR